MKMKRFKVQVEQILAILAAVVCLVVTILIWGEISLHQSMWPAPGLYFIEITAVCMVATALLLSGSALGRAALWVSAGIMLAFSLLAAFSVGLFYFPVAVLLVIAAIAADKRAGQAVLGHIGLLFAAGIMQATLTLAMVQFLY